MANKDVILKFVKPYPKLLILTMILGFSGAIFNGVSIALIVPIILRIVGQNVDLSGAPPILKAMLYPFDQVPENYRILVMSGAIIFTIALKNIATYASSIASSSLSRKLTADMREAGVKLLLEIDLDYFAKTKVGDLINRLGAEIGRAATAINNTLKIITLAITILVFIGLLLSISWELTVASTFLLGLVTLINQSAIARSRRFGKQLSEMSKGYSVAVLEALNGIRLVKATGNETKEYERICHLIRAREKADFEAQINGEAITPLSEVMGVAALLMIVFLSKTFFAEQVAALSTVLLSYLLVLLRILPLLSQLNTLRSNLSSTRASIDIVTEFLNLDNKPLMGNGTLKYTEFKEGIHFNSISFAYPGSEKLVIKDVDLYLPRGTTLALVGGSGAGKSTLADLLPRFYDPIQGKITIDGIDLREFDLKSIRKQMGIVSQDTFLFNDSVRNNIAYSKPDATEEEVIAAAKRANAYEFIIKLPQQFDTLIGDRGVMLSGGQRQRLAIARALLQNPEILILDEATSALDTVSERLVQEALDDLSSDRTTLVIAHRLSTVQKADQIAVLDQGRVVEVGTHNELLQKNGYYARLYSMQFTDGGSAKNTSKQDSSLNRISYELRTRLNSMIGFLSLLIDDLVDNPEEKHELIAEAYQSALRILNTIDILEDVVNLKIEWEIIPDPQQNSPESEQQTNLKDICDQFRTYINTLISSVRLLSDNNDLNPEEQNKLMTESYQSVMVIMSTLELFEGKTKLN
ncbi:MAG TPA: ATP-binding cassette domain-containing protein [Nostocaceae cyanobacterium]|nr:ATP-binding cassette domain-containing protein [Nostocaceae cyanobacterium]